MATKPKTNKSERRIEKMCPKCKSLNISDGKSDFIYSITEHREIPIRFCYDCYSEWFVLNSNDFSIEDRNFMKDFYFNLGKSQAQQDILELIEKIGQYPCGFIEGVDNLCDKIDKQELVTQIKNHIVFGKQNLQYRKIPSSPKGNVILQ